MSDLPPTSEYPQYEPPQEPSSTDPAKAQHSAAGSGYTAPTASYPALDQPSSGYAFPGQPPHGQGDPAQPAPGYAFPGQPAPGQGDPQPAPGYAFPGQPTSGYAPGQPIQGQPGSGYAPGQPGQSEPVSGYAPGQPGQSEPVSGYAPGQPGQSEPGSGYAPGQPGGNQPGQGYGTPVQGYPAPGQAQGYGAAGAAAYAPGQAGAYPAGQAQYLPGQVPAQGPDTPPTYAQQAGWQQAGYPAAPEKKSRKTLWISLGIVGVLLFCLCGAGIAAAVYWSNEKTDASGVTPSASQSKGGPSPAKSTAPATRVTLKAPDTIGGRKKSTDPTMLGALDGMKDNFEGLTSFGEPVAAIYGDQRKNDMMMIVAFPQEDELDSKLVLEGMFKGMETTGGTMSNKITVAPGKLGGSAQCADFKVESIDLAVCAWADNVSVGMVMWYFTTVSKVKSEFTTVREAIESKP